MVLHAYTLCAKTLIVSEDKAQRRIFRGTTDTN